jgi:hypothetical protein
VQPAGLGHQRGTQARPPTRLAPLAQRRALGPVALEKDEDEDVRDMAAVAVVGQRLGRRADKDHFPIYIALPCKPRAR